MEPVVVDARGVCDLVDDGHVDLLGEFVEETAEEAPKPAPRPSPDGLDAIASTESTEVPPDWDSAADEAAFDKFFSSDVEPEPAQRWLLNE